nr:hypothetical protein [Cyanobacteria bacterium RUI128]
MAKKKYTDVFVSDGIVQGTKGNDIFHILKTDMNTVVKPLKNGSKTVSQGSDTLYIEGAHTTDINDFSFKQQVDAEGNKTRNLEITTTDGRTIIIEDYFTDTTGRATKSSIKTLRLEYASSSNSWHSSLIGPQCKDLLITDINAIDYEGTFAPKKNKVTGTTFNDKIDMSETTKKLTIKGGLGNDIITSGKNNDTIIGGKGTNVFVYNEGSGNDTVKLTKGEKLV